jgi:hypothetical protein
LGFSGIIRAMRARGFTLFIRSTIASAIFLLCTIGNATAGGDEAIPTSAPKAWPTAIYQAAAAAPASFQYRFTNAFFDNTTDSVSNLFSDPFNPINTFPFSIWRDVFNNLDLFGTSTIVDHFLLRQDSDSLLSANSAFTNSTKIIDFLSFPFFDLRLGAEGYFEITRARQSAPKNLVVSITDPNSNVATSDDVQNINPYLQNSPLTSGNILAQLGHFLAPFKLVVKIPFSRADVTRMQVGEVVSYLTSGQVAFGGTLGWQVIPSHVIQVGASSTVETHLNGNFEVSVIKDDERYARVRVSKVRGHGESLEVNVGAQFSNLLTGFFLFSKASVADQLMDQVSEQVIPFQFDISGQKNQEIAVAYRYDLNSATGRDCYHHAVLGSLVCSESQANSEAGDANPTVTKLYDLATANNIHSHTVGINLSFFFGRSSTSSKQVLSTEITLPDGTSHIFSSSENQVHDAYDITGNNETTSQKVNVSVNEALFAAKKDGAVSVSFENSIEDSKTFGINLNRYGLQVSDYFSSEHLFPVFPEFAPNPRVSGKFKKSSYGRSSFFYGGSMTDAGVSAFLHADENATVDLASQLGIRMDTAAILAARAAFDSRDPQKTNAALSFLFNDKKHQRQYPKLILGRIDSSLYELYLIAQSSVFGALQYRGHQMPAFENLMNATSDSMGQATLAHPATENAAAQVENLTTEVLDNQQVALHFQLASVPEYLYFHVANLHPTRQQKKQEVDLIVFNRNHRFVAGDNTLVLDPKSADDLIHQLTAQLVPTENVLVTVGYTPDENSWGNAASAQFQCTDVY